jgi:bidirectional [NiFe] hydrogenase diaphorase subunit
MVVHTDTPKLRAHRRLIVELLFAERNHVCSVCVMNGDCELQDLATALGIDHVRVRYQFPSLPVDLTHERFGLDHNRCILCTRCIRVCDEVEGAHTWDMMGRGTNARVISDLDEPWGSSDSCTSCGKCVQVCPTGALFSKGKAVGRCARTARSSSISSRPGRKSNGSSDPKAAPGDGVAGRLFRLPHVFSRSG